MLYLQTDVDKAYTILLSSRLYLYDPKQTYKFLSYLNFLFFYFFFNIL